MDSSKQDTRPAGRIKNFGHPVLERDNQLLHFMDLVLNDGKGTSVYMSEGSQDRIKVPFCHHRMKTKQGTIKHRTMADDQNSSLGTPEIVNISNHQQPPHQENAHHRTDGGRSQSQQ